MLTSTLRVAAVLSVLAAANGAVSLQAQGATFYVSTTGANTNPGTEALPWRTIQKAASTLLAGQTALVRAGTYTEFSINFANSGTAGNPITIKNYPGETPIIDGGFTTSAPVVGTFKPVFDIDGDSFITLDGLTITRGQGANILISEDAGANQVTIQNCTLTHFVTGDNAAAIYVNSSTDNLLIRNNVIHTRLQGGDRNHIGSGIILFNARNVTIENNEIYDLIYAIYYKHSVSGIFTTTVQKNKIHDTFSAGILWSRRDALIRDNVIYNAADAGIHIFEESATCASLVSSGNQIIHNTIVDTLIGIFLTRSGSCPGAVGTVVRDNVISHFTNGEHRGVSIFAYFSPDSSSTTLQKNLVHSAPFPSPVRVLASYYPVTSLPATVTASGNVALAPQYVNYTGDNFSLAPGPGKGAASDGLDMGALVCAAGVNASCTVPSKVTNFRVTPF